jgi:hypothetical protein
MIGSMAALVLLASLGQQSNDSKKDFKFDFRGAKVNESLFRFPPEQVKYFTPEPAGFRITLPGDSEQPGTHVGPFVQSLPEGNFELTLAYEILSRDRGENPDWGPGVAVYLRINGGLNDGITIVRQSRGNGEERVASVQLVDEATDKGNKRITKQSHSLVVKNDVLTGKLHLFRQGKELFAEFAEGDGRFRELDRFIISDAPVGQLRIAVDPSSKKKAIDVRFTELEVKRAEPSGRRWWIGGLISLLLVLTLGMALFARRKRAARNAQPTCAAADAIISFPCDCGTLLKVKLESMGKDVSCPECGKTVTVPK